MKRSVCVLILALTACGPARVPVNPPTPPVAAVDIVSLLFSTSCRDIGGGTTVCDSVDSTGLITRKTYTPGNHFGLNGEEIETWSLYQRDDWTMANGTSKHCVSVWREETRIHATNELQALQVYGDADVPPCWINQLTAFSDGSTLDSGLHEFNWTWTHYDTNGVQIGDAAHGRVSDRTKLTITAAGATLIERYEDLADITSIYCGVASYQMPAPGGMITVRQDTGACK